VTGRIRCPLNVPIPRNIRNMSIWDKSCRDKYPGQNDRKIQKSELWRDARSLNIGLPGLAESFILTDIGLITVRHVCLIFKSGEPPFDSRPSSP
jgi:hypothetical protein